jgi:hypothetical protein
MKSITDFFTGALHSKAAHWMAAIAAATAYVTYLSTVSLPAGAPDWVFPLLIIAPGLVTMALIPGAWRKWYRWVTVAFLTLSVYSELLVLVMTVGTAWALYRSWFLERTFPIRKLFSRDIRKRRSATPKIVIDPKNRKFSDATDILFAEHRANKAAKSGKAATQAAKTATVQAAKARAKASAGA